MHMTEMFTTQYPGLHNSVLLVYLFLFTVFVLLLPSHFRKLWLSNVPVNIIFDHCQLWPSVFVIGFDISSPWPWPWDPSPWPWDQSPWPWPWYLKALALALTLWPVSLALGPKSLLTSLPTTKGKSATEKVISLNFSLKINYGLCSSMVVLMQLLINLLERSRVSCTGISSH